MPLAEVTRGVARGLQQARQCHRLWIQPVHLAGLTILRSRAYGLVNAEPRGKLPGGECRAARRADGAAGIKLVELRAVARQPVDVRSVHQLVPMAGEVAPAPVIGQDEDDVWARGWFHRHP